MWLAFPLGNWYKVGMDTSSYPKAFEDARNRKGMSLQQVADAIGVPCEHARDIEMHEDELASTLTLYQLMALLACLELSIAHNPSSIYRPAFLQARLSRLIGFCRFHL